MNDTHFRGLALRTPFRPPLKQVSSVTNRSFSGHRQRTETPCKVENATDTSSPPPPCERLVFGPRGGCGSAPPGSGAPCPGARIPAGARSALSPARRAPPPAAPASAGGVAGLGLPGTAQRALSGPGTEDALFWSIQAAPPRARAAREAPRALPSGARQTPAHLISGFLT